MVRRSQPREQPAPSRPLGLREIDKEALVKDPSLQFFTIPHFDSQPRCCRGPGGSTRSAAGLVEVTEVAGGLALAHLGKARTGMAAHRGTPGGGVTRHEGRDAEADLAGESRRAVHDELHCDGGEQEAEDPREEVEQRGRDPVAEPLCQQQHRGDD